MDQTNYQFYNTSPAAWEAMYQAILGAQESIFWELYSLVDDKAGQRFVDALCNQAAQGIEVKLVLDAIGSRDLSAYSYWRLVSAGVRVVWHNKLRLDLPSRFLKRLWHRNHRKLLIIDEEKVFLGGVNVQGQAADWYDLHLFLRMWPGEINILLRSFAKSFVRANGKPEEVQQFLKLRQKKNLDSKIGFIINSPAYNLRHPFSLRRFYWQAIKNAKENFNLVTPYYSPDTRFLQLLNRATKRGVKADIILPWMPDHRFMQWVAHAFFDLTKKAGGSIYFLNTMNHAKSFSVDNNLGLVGSVNLTPRSFFVNQEICAYFTDEKMVRDLNSIFSNWKNEATPLSDVGWGKRGRWRRFREWVAKHFSDYV